MSRGPYPHCPIAPGKGCQSCYDGYAEQRTTRRAFWREIVIRLTIAQVIIAAMVGAWLVLR